MSSSSCGTAKASANPLLLDVARPIVVDFAGGFDFSLSDERVPAWRVVEPLSVGGVVSMSVLKKGIHKLSHSSSVF